MGLIAWFKGFFTETKKEQRKRRKSVVNKRLYVDNKQLPECGKLTALDARKLIVKFSNLNALRTANKLNKMGYLTPAGNPWTTKAVHYWKRDYVDILKHREYCKNYKRNNKRANIVVEYRYNQNGIN